MIGEELLRFQKKQIYRLFDFETCNLNLVHEKNLPWEYASWTVTPEKVIKKTYLLINWELIGRKIDISDDAARMTGFYAKYPKLLSTGVHPEKALEIIDSELYDINSRPVAHNGLGFDVYIHNTMRKILGKPTDYSYIKRLIDTNLIAKGWKLEIPIPKDRNDLTSYQYKLYSHIVRGVKTSVKALCADLGIEYDETRAHDADYDCHLLNEILKNLLWKVEL